MPQALCNYLAKLRQIRKAQANDFVVLSCEGVMLSYEIYLRAVKRVCKEAGVGVVTPHELRHSCTEMYIQAGASAEDIRRLLNQSSLTATARYIHRTEERLNGIAAQIHLGLLPGPGRPPQLRVVKMGTSSDE